MIDISPGRSSSIGGTEQWTLTKKKQSTCFLHRLSEPRWNLWFRLEASLFKWPHSPSEGAWTATWQYPNLVRPTSLPLSPYLGTDLRRAQARRLLASLSPWPVIGWRIGLWSVWANKTWVKGLLAASGTKASSLSWKKFKYIFSLGKDNYVSYLSRLTNYLKPSGFTQQIIITSQFLRARNPGIILTAQRLFWGALSPEVWSEARIGLQPHWLNCPSSRPLSGCW